MEDTRAVVLLSGGIDSSTALAMARAEGYDCYALSFAYAQRHIIELESAKKVAASQGVKRHLIIDFNLRQIGGSALTADIEVPKKKHNQESVTAGAIHIPPTYVPARNTIFLSFGLAWAEVLKAPIIVIGANAVDYSGYPDCRPEYLTAFEEMANLATKISVEGRIRFRIHAPLLHMTKGEIIQRGAKLGLDHALTWSCYDPRQRTSGMPVPCGMCDSCRIRIKGFKDAGMPDPLLHR